MVLMDSGSISSVSINFIRSRRGAGARGSRIHVRGVLGDSFCGVARVAWYTGVIIYSTTSFQNLRCVIGLVWVLRLCCVVFGSGLRELKMAEPERHLSGTK